MSFLIGHPEMRNLRFPCCQENAHVGISENGWACEMRYPPRSRSSTEKKAKIAGEDHKNRWHWSGTTSSSACRATQHKQHDTFPRQVRAKHDTEMSHELSRVNWICAQEGKKAIWILGFNALRLERVYNFQARERQVFANTRAIEQHLFWIAEVETERTTWMVLSRSLTLNGANGALQQGQWGACMQSRTTSHVTCFLTSRILKITFSSSPRSDPAFLQKERKTLLQFLVSQRKREVSRGARKVANVRCGGCSFAH